MSAPARADAWSPGSDGDCSTRPTTYPADGQPLPPEATCMLAVDSLGVPAAELWWWRDHTTVTWYNYAVDGVTFSDAMALAMCGTYAQDQVGPMDACTPDSEYLIFTSSSVFVALPLGVDDDLYFCESLSIVTPLIETATACGVATETDITTPTPTPTPPPPAGPPADAVAPSAAPTSPSVPVSPSEPPPTSTDPRDDTVGATSSAPGSTAPPTQGTTGAAQAPDDTPSSARPTDADAAGPTHPIDAGVIAMSTPDHGVSVATVRHAPFPIRAMVILAGVLGAFGVAVLLVPSTREIRRRRLD